MDNRRHSNRLVASLLLASVGAVSACTSLPAPGAAPTGFAVEATVAVGRAPHGIRFSRDGARAFVALSGDDSIAILDAQTTRVIEKRAAGKTPLDLVALNDGEWLVTQFRGDELITLGGPARWNVGKGPSLFSPQTPRGKAYLAGRAATRFAHTTAAVDVATVAR